jgi:hypothetical protein
MSPAAPTERIRRWTVELALPEIVNIIGVV